jgi:hypothetical protein
MQDPISTGRRSKRSVGGQTEDRRVSNRAVLSAVAEVTEKTSRTKLAVRIGDLSMHGCYADSLTVFPPGTWVQICIRHASSQLQTAARVIYSRSGLGMGLCFEDLNPDKVAILQSWTSGVDQEDAPEMEIQNSNKTVEGAPRAERHTLANLINVLMRKGLLTSTEGTEMLLELRKNF